MLTPIRSATPRRAPFTSPQPEPAIPTHNALPKYSLATPIRKAHPTACSALPHHIAPHITPSPAPIRNRPPTTSRNPSSLLESRPSPSASHRTRYGPPQRLSASASTTLRTTPPLARRPLGRPLTSPTPLRLSPAPICNRSHHGPLYPPTHSTHTLPPTPHAHYGHPPTRAHNLTYPL